MTEDVAKFRLDDLYNTEAVVTMPDGSEVLVRTLTEAEVSVRDLAATRASKDAEDVLRDEESSEHDELIKPLDGLSREELSAVIMGFAMVAIRREVQEDYPYRYIPFPEDATEEEKEETLRRRDEHEARVRQNRSEELSKRMVQRREELSDLDEEQLHARSVMAMVRAQKLNARIEEFNVQTLYMACRNENGKPFFDEDIVRRHGTRDGLNDSVYKKLLSVYAELDRADPWLLQKHS